MRPKLGLRDSILAIALLALGILAAIQGRKVAELESEVAGLRKQNARFQAQNVQISNNIIRFNQYVNEELNGLHREVEALKKQMPAATSRPMP